MSQHYGLTPEDRGASEDELLDSVVARCDGCGAGLYELDPTWYGTVDAPGRQPYEAPFFWCNKDCEERAEACA